MTASSPPRASSRPARRLTVERWIEEGFALIAEEGLRAVKIDRLCERLGVTKGSFYWHFDDVDAYFRALAEAWGRIQREGRTSLEGLKELAPQQRLVAMMRHLTSPRQWMLERAMREWARWDERVAAEVRASDRWVFGKVRRAFLDAGFAAPEATARARVSFAAGIGFIHLAESAPRAGETREHERFLELMLRP
jgi:AcrR family transcriptional regulator